MNTNVTVSQGIVEGLLVRGLKLVEDPTACLELRARGVDLDQLPKQLPLGQWTQAVEWAALHLYPSLPRAQAMRNLGRAFVDGYLQTLAGALFAQILPLLTPQRFCQLFPIYLRTGRSDFEATVQSGPHATRIHIKEEASMPEFMAGLVEAALARTRGQATVEVGTREAHSYELLVRWP